jgi:glyoxylate reductase
VTRPLLGHALERLAAEHETEVWPHDDAPPSAAEVRERAREVDGLLVQHARIDADLLDACPALRVVSNYGVGLDNVDVEACTARGVLVGNTPDVLTDTTADMAFALLLAAARRLKEADAVVREGRWGEWVFNGLLGHEVSGATLGLVGFGEIARAVARRGEGFGMEILHFRRSGGGVALPELLERSDFVSLHVPLTPETRHLIDEAALRSMRENAILVNTARGGVVDQGALERALREGWIAGAAIDVTDPEPLPADHSLLGAPNLLVAPHVGSGTRRARERMADLAVGNLLAGLAGRPMPSCVNPGAAPA